MPINSLGTEAPVSYIDEVRREDYPLRKKNRALELSIVTGKDPNEIAQATEMGDTSVIVESKEVVKPSQDRLLNNLQQQNAAPQDAVRLLAEQAQKITEMMGNSDLILEGALTYGDPNFSPTLARTIVNQAIAAEMAEQMLNDNWEEASTGGLILDALDRFILRQLPIGMLEDFSLRGERRGEDMLQAAGSMSTEEWIPFVKAQLEEANKEGVFRSENFFAIQQQYDEFINSGYDPGAAWNAAFAALDLPIKPLSLAFSGKLLTKIAKMRGPKAASESFREMFSKSGKGIDPEIQVETNPKVVDPSTHPEVVKPTVSKTTEIFENNSLLPEIDALTKVGAFGRRASAEQINSLVEEVKSTLEKTLDRPLADYTLEDLPLGEKKVVFFMGKNEDGSPWGNAGLASIRAKQLTERGLPASVRLVDETNPRLGYFVTIEQNLDLTDVVDHVSMTDINNVFTRSIGRVLSTRVFDDPLMNVRALQGTSAAASLNKLAQGLIKKLEKLPVKRQETLGQIYSDLRDGADSYLRQAYTEEEFASKWHQYTGKEPSPQDYEAFVAAQTLNDTSYFIFANELARKFSNAGFMALDDAAGTTTVAKRAVSVADDAKVKDILNDVELKGSEVPDGVAVWQTEEGDLFIRPKKVRSLEYRDVYNYNAGGQRLNPDARYFVSLVDGENSRGVRAILTAFSEKQAIKATEEFRTIRDEFLRVGLKFGELTDELDVVIRSNNTWNPSIENTSDFVKWAEANKVDFKYDVSYKPRDGIVESANDLWDSTNYDQFFRAKLKRSDDVLTSYGGDKTFNNNPVKDIVAQVNSAFGSYAMRNYTESALASWVAKAYRKEKLDKGINPKVLFDNKLDKLKKARYVTAEDQRLIDIGNVIRRRLDIQDPLTRDMSRYGNRVREFVFDKTGAKIPEISFQSGLLNLGFQSAFGFFNLSQFIVQSSQVGAIAILSPRHGLKAASIVPALRLALHNGTPEAVKRAAKIMGVSEKDAEDLFTYIRTSGRNDVESDALEKSIGPGFGTIGYNGQSYVPSAIREGLYRTSQVGKLMLKAGTTPFTEGERLTRLTGITTAALEFKAKYPDMSILSDFGRQWITNRENALTFDMTTSSKAAVQQGIWRLPSQWTSYAFRAMEAVVVGSRKTGKNAEFTGLTEIERARLGLFLVAQGGLAGFGIGYAADELSEWLGVEPDSVGFTSIKYGFYDAIFSYFFQGITGDEDLRTAMGSRLAPWTVFIDIYRKIFEEETWSTLGGPSLEIAGTAMGEGIKAIGNVYDGAYLSAWEDIQKVLRTPAGINNIAVTRGILQHGVYRSKSGKSLPMEFDESDAVLSALGISNAKVVDYYNTKSEVWRDTKELNAFAKELTNDFKKANDYYREGDEDTGLALLKEISARIDVSGFSEYDKMALRRRLKEDTRDELNELMWYFIRRNQDYAANVLNSYRDSN